MPELTLEELNMLETRVILPEEPHPTQTGNKVEKIINGRPETVYEYTDGKWRY